MKRLCWIITSSTVALLWIFAVVFFVLTDLQMLEHEEFLKLKSGKQFWTWETPKGSYDMHYVEKGEGSNHILFIHGFRSHTFTWRFLLDPLAKAGFHVWAMDLIGYGLSDKPDHEAYDIPFFIDQIVAFMNAKGISKAHIVGNSMGGGIALNIALLYPSQVSSLSLLNALGYPHELPFYVSIARHISLVWTPFLGPRMVRQTLNYIVFDQDNISNEQVEAYTLPYRLPGGITSTLLTLQQFDSQILENMAKQYTGLEHPMLVIWGEDDSQIPVTHFEKFVTDFPNCHKLLIPKCGHIPQEETPHEVLAAMMDFLKKY